MSPNTNHMEHLEHDDDKPVGRILSRREVLTLFAGLGGAALLTACGIDQPGTAQPTNTAQGATGGTTGTPLNSEAATAVVATPAEASPTADAAAVPDCVVKPDMTEGPYFVDEDLNRSDIRETSEGLPLTLGFVVSQIASNACTPLKDAQVDIWHCDAAGQYSDVADNTVGFTTTGQKFLRGYQLTDASGKAGFTTIYPGWYQGRAVHIHFKIRTTGTDGQPYEFTSQLFFDEALSDKVFSNAPYSSKGQRNTLNSNDNIYSNGGDQMLLNPTGDTSQSLSATFSIALDLSDIESGADDSSGGGGGGPGGPP